PGITSARKVTIIPGRAHTFPACLKSLRGVDIFFLLKYAVTAPSALAAIAKPPISRLVRFFIDTHSQSESKRAVIVGRPLNARSALIPVKCVHSAGTPASVKIASTGHSGTQASQSIHVSGL